MRPLRFRIWSAKANRWLTPEDKVVLRSDGTTVRYAHVDDGEVVDGYEGIAEIEITGLTVCLWTGLYDKNGVSIYDGDIVQASKAEGGATHRVEWRHGALGDEQYLGDFVGFTFDSDFRTMTVIGNVYQHAQLLEAKS